MGYLYKVDPSPVESAAPRDFHPSSGSSSSSSSSAKPVSYSFLDARVRVRQAENLIPNLGSCDVVANQETVTRYIASLKLAYEMNPCPPLKQKLSDAFNFIATKFTQANREGSIDESRCRNAIESIKAVINDDQLVKVFKRNPKYFDLITSAPCDENGAPQDPVLKYFLSKHPEAKTKEAFFAAHSSQDINGVSSEQKVARKINYHKFSECGQSTITRENLAPFSRICSENPNLFLHVEDKSLTMTEGAYLVEAMYKNENFRVAINSKLMAEKFEQLIYTKISAVPTHEMIFIFREKIIERGDELKVVENYINSDLINTTDEPKNIERLVDLDADNEKTFYLIKVKKAGVTFEAFNAVKKGILR